ncbi:sporulation membrane protein YtrI [Bacillus chungangensis]|uniref:MFS superfamily sulfate permease-like transporter n=1 Tax=Bacillus chungangensis TaxID=587633 RepID=A0ABT9WN66_9BACI|nr:sporulation membrane protein YtrI [Bacillus chungangensis]MDQ0174544.1 MFS superfamily sulfate permease-like transporter [Bacillus chungangensis]
MRVPLLSRYRYLQLLLAGIVLGVCMSWLLFLFMFGTIQEKQTRTIEEQQNKIAEMKKTLSIWQEDYKELNKKNQEILTVQKLHIKIVHNKKYQIHETQSIFEAQEAIKEDLHMLLAKDLASIYKNRELIKKIIENKTLRINDRRYRLQIKEMYFYTTITAILELKLAE